MKASGEQYDDRIVEVVWDDTRSSWRIIRMRDDKKHANFKGVVEAILLSIADGLEIDAVSADH